MLIGDNISKWEILTHGLPDWASRSNKIGPKTEVELFKKAYCKQQFTPTVLAYVSTGFGAAALISLVAKSSPLVKICLTVSYIVTALAFFGWRYHTLANLLHLQIVEEKEDKAIALIENGANIFSNIRTPKHTRMQPTPLLSLAALANCPRVVQKLINIRSFSDEALAHALSGASSSETVMQLVKGIDPDHIPRILNEVPLKWIPDLEGHSTLFHQFGHLTNAAWEVYFPYSLEKEDRIIHHAKKMHTLLDLGAKLNPKDLASGTITLYADFVAKYPHIQELATLGTRLFPNEEN